MITEEDVIEIVNRYPNLELSIYTNNLLKNNTRRLLVYVNSKAFPYGCNLLVEYDYCSVPKNGILQVNNGNQHIYSDWGYITEDSIYLFASFFTHFKHNIFTRFHLLIVRIHFISNHPLFFIT